MDYRKTSGRRKPDRGPAPGKAAKPPHKRRGVVTWRATYDEPAYRVEIDGDPSLACTLGWPQGSDPASSNYNLNVARAMNIMPRLVAAKPGLLTPVDFPAPVASDGLAPL
jgi:hypothetical protein